MADVDRIEGWLLFNRTCRDSRAHEVASEWVRLVGSWKKAMEWFEYGIWSPKLVGEILDRGYNLSDIMNKDIPESILKSACKSPSKWDKFFVCLE